MVTIQQLQVKFEMTAAVTMKVLLSNIEEKYLISCFCSFITGFSLLNVAFTTILDTGAAEVSSDRQCKVWSCDDL